MSATRTKKRPEIAGLNPLPRMTPHTLRRTYISIMLAGLRAFDTLVAGARCHSASWMSGRGIPVRLGFIHSG